MLKATNIPLSAFVVAIALYLLSVISYNQPLISGIILGIIGIITIYLGYKNTKLGLGLILIELFVGSQGRLLTASIFDFQITLREVLFIGLLLGWLSGKIIRKQKIILAPSQFKGPWLVLAASIIISMILGWLRYGQAQMIPDANGYWYLLLAPLIMDIIQANDWQLLGKWLAGSQLVVIIFTLFALLLFAWQPLNPIYFYKWLRDIRLGEVTYVVGTYFRIFLQSQIYSLVLALGALTAVVTSGLWKRKYTIVIALISSLVVIASLSRSFWAGMIIGVVVLLLLLKKKLNWGLKKISTLFGMIILCVIAEGVFLQIITGNFPSPAFNSRLTNFGTEAAAVSRIAQFKPLLNAIGQHPILGSGFGRTVSYITADPRRLAENVQVTTTSFELGWLDTWLDLGLLGLIALAWWLWRLVKWSWQGSAHNSGAAITVVIVVALIVVHAFTPYLNHPLGLGLVMVLSALTPRTKNTTHV